MNKFAFAMKILELHLDEWEPISVNGLFFIRHKKTDQYIGKGKNLKAAILKAREFELEKLKNK